MPTLDIITYSDADFSVDFASVEDIGSNPLHMHVRTDAANPTVWIEATTENEMLAVAATTDGSIVTLTISQSKLLNLPAGEYVHSCIMSLFDGLERVEIWRGTLTHNIGPTRWEAGTP